MHLNSINYTTTMEYYNKCVMYNFATTTIANQYIALNGILGLATSSGSERERERERETEVKKRNEIFIIENEVPEIWRTNPNSETDIPKINLDSEIPIEKLILTI